MIDAEKYQALQVQLLELCKDVLMVDLAALVQKMDAEEVEGPRRDPAGWARERARFEALKKTAIAFLAAKGMADAYREVYLENLRKQREGWGGDDGK